jgi:predicted RNA-binding protein YlqC (UPF0109 family)
MSVLVYPRHNSNPGKGESVKDLIEFIARSLVDDPTQVQVAQERSGSKVHLELRVAKEDMGRVIGKNGRVANALRILLRVAAAREGKQITLDVIEPR